jgi:hypothetical protein
MKSIRYALAALLAAVPVAGIAAPVPQAAVQPPVSEAHAAELLALIFPQERIIALNLASAQKELDAGYAANDKVIALEPKQPGIRAALVAAAMRELEAIYRRGLPALDAELRAMLRQRLSDAESIELIAFFGSPTGAKLVAAMNEGVAASDGDTQADFRADGRNRAVSAIGPEDGPALEAFGRSAAYPKVKQLTPAIQAASDRAFAAMSQQLDERLPALSRETIQAFPGTVR